MPKLTNRTPAYCKHKASGQAIVTINGHDVYIGPHATRASKAEYDRVIAEYLVNGRGLSTAKRTDTTISEVLAGFWKHAQTYYTSDAGHTGELGSYRLVLRLLKRLYGSTPAAEFGPLPLKAVREAMEPTGLEVCDKGE